MTLLAPLLVAGAAALLALVAAAALPLVRELGVPTISTISVYEELYKPVSKNVCAIGGDHEVGAKALVEAMIMRGDDASAAGASTSELMMIRGPFLIEAPFHDAKDRGRCLAGLAGWSERVGRAAFGIRHRAALLAHVKPPIGRA